MHKLFLLNAISLLVGCSIVAQGAERNIQEVLEERYKRVVNETPEPGILPAVVVKELEQHHLAQTTDKLATSDTLYRGATKPSETTKCDCAQNVDPHENRNADSESDLTRRAGAERTSSVEESCPGVNQLAPKAPQEALAAHEGIEPAQEAEVSKEAEVDEKVKVKEEIVEHKSRAGDETKEGKKSKNKNKKNSKRDKRDTKARNSKTENKEKKSKGKSKRSADGKTSKSGESKQNKKGSNKDKKNRK